MYVYVTIKKQTEGLLQLGMKFVEVTKNLHAPLGPVSCGRVIVVGLVARKHYSHSLTLLSDA
jgi:hypothetical protein